MPSGGASDAPAEPTSESTTAAAGDAPHKRRRRRRRKGPRPEGAPGEAAASGEGDASAHIETENTLHLPEGAATVPSEGGEVAAAGEGPKRKRRRRRRKPRPEGAAVPLLDENGQPIVTVSGEGATDAEGAPAVPRAPRPPGSRPPRRRRLRQDGETAASAGTGETAPRQVMGPFLPRAHRPRGEGAPEGQRPPRERKPRGDRPPRDRAAAGDRPPRERGPGDRGPSDRGPNDRGPRDRDRRPGGGGGKFGKGGGRGDARNDRPPQKLYTMESVVDRGFDEVPDAENEGVTKRSDWSIVKRTVADQRAAKAVSAMYVLKREGGDTEFGNLAAARAAVNKTIVHPEKLTKAKGDYGSTKK